jgi:hypothetical protein
MLAQLEVEEINSRTFKDFYLFSRTSCPGIIFPIQGLSRIFKAHEHPAVIRYRIRIGATSNFTVSRGV